MNNPLNEKLHSLPKVELHRHLVGSVRLETLVQIAAENNIKLPTQSVKKLALLLTMKKPASSLREFLKPLLVIQQCFCQQETVRRIAYEVVEDASKDNIRYLELIFGPAFEAGAHKLSLDEVFKGVSDGVEQAMTNFPIKVGLIPGPTLRWREHRWHSPQEVLDVAIDYMRRGIIGFGLSSESKEGELILRKDSQLRKEFVKLSRRAKDAGLYLTVHAGEVSGAESVWDALRILRADRIGHGIGVVKNKKILRHAIKNRVPLEICLTSNVLTGAVQNLQSHPIKKLYDLGAVVTVNTDDPTLCQTTLTREYLKLMKTFHFSFSDVEKIVSNGLESAFVQPQDKEKMLKSISTH